MKYEGVDLEKAGLKLHDGEPWFLIRGQDVLAPEAVESYIELLRREGETRSAYAADKSGTLKRSAEELEGFVEQIRHWQSKNRDKVKLPD